MWTTRAIIDWLATLGIGEGLTVDLVMSPGPYVPDMPDNVGVVTTIPGPGLSMEGVADTGGFQLLIRGLQDPTSTDASAEENALRADRLIIRASLPAEVVTGVRLLPISRSGGRPAPLPQEDDGDRITFVCTYLTPVLEEASS
jgi:hypothetical protein